MDVLIQLHSTYYYYILCTPYRQTHSKNWVATPAIVRILLCSVGALTPSCLEIINFYYLLYAVLGALHFPDIQKPIIMVSIHLQGEEQQSQQQSNPKSVLGAYIFKVHAS